MISFVVSLKLLLDYYNWDELSYPMLMDVRAGCVPQCICGVLRMIWRSIEYGPCWRRRETGKWGSRLNRAARLMGVRPLRKHDSVSWGSVPAIRQTPTLSHMADLKCHERWRQSPRQPSPSGERLRSSKIFRRQFTSPPFYMPCL